GHLGLVDTQPICAIGQCATCHRLFFGLGFILAPEAAATFWTDYCARIERRKQAEIDVHWLERPLAGFIVADQMPAGNVIEQRPEGRCQRRWRQALTQAFGGGEATGDEADGGTLDIALAAGNLPGKTQSRTGLELK